MSGGGGKGGGSQNVTSSVQIPAFLRPFIEESAGVGQGALQGLTQLLQPGGAGTPGANLVAGMTPDQLAAIEQARGVAGGAGGFIPTAQDVVSRQAQGTLIDPAALQALQQTAGGDFLFGGQGFNQAVQAALRQATPAILNTFGESGTGGATGGLAQTAIGTAATDAFARQFGQERLNQLNASQVLANEQGRQTNAALALPGLGLIPSDILAQIGALLQAQNQANLTAPIQSLLQLQGAAQGVPSAFSPLLGRSESQSISSNPFGNALGGLTTALGLGAAIFPAAQPAFAAANPGGFAHGLLGGLF